MASSDSPAVHYINSDEQKSPVPSHKSDEETQNPAIVIAEEDADAAGAKTVEATFRVFGRYSRWALFIGLGLAAYIYSLDGQTTYTYLAYATSSLGDHGLLATVQTAQAIIIACGKPVVAKLADVSSRGSAFLFVLVFYVVGYIVIASAHSIETICGGIILYAVGYTGLQLLTQIIIADITTLKWRGLVSSLISAPFIINAFVGSNISAQVVGRSGWRWGYGMFAILIPVSLAPLIVTLLWAERKAKRLGLVVKREQQHSLPARLYHTAQKLDVMGLLLIGTSVALILLPLTLAKGAKGQWDNPSMIAMEVVGCVLLIAVAVWDFKFAAYPAIPRRFVVNRSVVFASLIGFFDFISFYLNYTYLYSFILVTKDWPLVNTTYFTSCQSVALTVFGITAGLLMRFFKSYKIILVVGLCIRLLGAGLMIHSRGANASDAEVVWTQILQGMGGGIAAVAIQVGAQASVTHADVAMATAVVLLVTEIGGSIGTAVAGAIWTGRMPGELAKALGAFLGQEEIDAIYASVTVAAGLPRGDPTREGVIMAYGNVMHLMCIIATAMAVPPIIFACFMPDWTLGDEQNAVDMINLAGEQENEQREEAVGANGSKVV
ncbi:major facilitator superfamily domain-containing protein [Schizophyllum fasciatum]